MQFGQTRKHCFRDLGVPNLEIFLLPGKFCLSNNVSNGGQTGKNLRKHNVSGTTPIYAHQKSSWLCKHKLYSHLLFATFHTLYSVAHVLDQLVEELITAQKGVQPLTEEQLLNMLILGSG